MITRRDALKLSAAGLIAPAIGFAMQREAIAMQEVVASWPMQGGNPARTGVMTGSGPTFDAPLMVKWDWSTISAGGWSRPVVHQGMMYYFPGDMTGLLALDFETGTERWRALAEHTISSHIVLGSTIFVAADDILHALDTATGQERWMRQLNGIVERSMVGVDGTLYCRTRLGGVVALNADDGAQRWYFDERGEDESALAMHDGTLFFSSNSGTLFALDAETGTEQWRLAIPTGEYGFSHIIVADGTLYLRDYEGGLWAIDPTTGTERWRTAADPTFNLSAAHDGRVFGSSAVPGALAIDGLTGEVLWNVTADLAMSVSGVFGDTVLAQGTAGAYDMWRVYGLDAATGQERWSFESYPRMYDPTVIGDRLMLHGLVGYVLANPSFARLIQDVTVRGAPASTGIERGSAVAGTEIDSVGERVDSGGEVWVRVTIGDLTGWIPLAAIDPATLSPDGEVKYVYVP